MPLARPPQMLLLAARQDPACVVVVVVSLEKWCPPRFQVCRPQRPAHRGLEKLLQEFSRQGHTLSQVCREKAALAQEKAALEARLAATERDLQGLSEQLVEAR